MKKRKVQKLGINKSVISHLTQQQVVGGATHTCPAACCPTEFATCANTCAATCANTCANTCPAGCGITGDCGSGTGPSRICPTIQI